MPQQSLQIIDPLTDNRWDEFVASHLDSSIFHHSGWLRALAKTYGFRPMVLTDAHNAKQLSNGIAFCEVRSWITGARLVSLPFSDHCEPLLNGDEKVSELIAWIKAESDRRKWRYVEFRPLRAELGADPFVVPGQSFWFHELSLDPPLNRIFESLHKDSVQRRIRRAEREGLVYEAGCTERFLEDFYRLLILTRMRHGLPPQPRSWFRNIVECLHPHVQIRLARKDAEPVAAIFTLLHKDTVVYKYGCSDQRFHNLAGMPFLFWKLIEESKAAGLRKLDFGRTDLENTGLVRFKDQFGTQKRRLTYLQCRARAREAIEASSHRLAARHVLSMLPNNVSSLLGSLLYRHIA